MLIVNCTAVFTQSESFIKDAKYDLNEYGKFIKFISRSSYGKKFHRNLDNISFTATLTLKCSKSVNNELS